MHRGVSKPLLLWRFPLAAVLFIACWQWVTVNANYGGNWTALYCTGGLQPVPTLVPPESIYVFPNSTGYDGQFYHYLAHDPSVRGNLKSYFDDPRLRYRRILVPLAAHVLALGQSQWVDPAYEIFFLCCMALGVYWSCRFARHADLPEAWGLLFLLMPAIPVTMDRLVADGALAAATSAFLLYSGRAGWKLFLLLVCAALIRETGLLLIAACSLFHVLRRDFRTAAILAAAAVPALGWYAFVQEQTTAGHYTFSPVPLAAIAHALASPMKYPPGTPFIAAVLAADYLAFAGGLLAVGIALYWSLRPDSPIRIAAGLFAALELVQPADHWRHVYDYGRLQTPLLLCLAATAARRRNPWLLAPLFMMLPRLAIQFAPQFLGVMRGFA